MKKCKCCKKEYKDECCHGQHVPANGRVIMSYGSRYDMNVYQFTLIEGWYCYECLDKEVKEGLCQPIKEWKSSDEAFNWFVPRTLDNGIDWERQKSNFDKMLGPG